MAALPGQGSRRPPFTTSPHFFAKTCSPTEAGLTRSGGTGGRSRLAHQSWPGRKHIPSQGNRARCVPALPSSLQRGGVCVSFTSKNMLCAEQPGSAWPSGNLLELTGHISVLTAYVPYTTQSCCFSPGRERGLKHEGDSKLAPRCWRWPRDSIACPQTAFWNYLTGLFKTGASLEAADRSLWNICPGISFHKNYLQAIIFSMYLQM